MFLKCFIKSARNGFNNFHQTGKKVLKFCEGINPNYIHCTYLNFLDNITSFKIMKIINCIVGQFIIKVLYNQFIITNFFSFTLNLIFKFEPLNNLKPSKFYCPIFNFYSFQN